MPLFGVIGGSGLYDIPGLKITDAVKISTPYGEPSDVYRIGTLSGREIAFLPRHGSMHHIQPHRINYRANIWGFRELGAARIISIGASGGISPAMKPGALAVPDQIIDITHGRLSTFYDEDEVVHIDFTEPFCPDTRKYLFMAAEQADINIISPGVYVCSNGPRLETAAEIRTFSLWGSDMIGMTAMPEASLARELGICFALVSVITNRAAGIAGEKLTAVEVIGTMQSAAKDIHSLLAAYFGLEFSGPSCSCRQAIDEAKI